jgi:hypothetical protein
MIYLPIITAQDYESFCAILNSHIPHAYDKWLKLHAVWRHHHIAERNLIRDVPVSAARFAKHLKVTGHAPDVGELLIFTENTAKETTH